jgi:hypothetical protein
MGATKKTSLKVITTAGFVFGFLYQFVPCWPEARHTCQAGLVPAGATIFGIGTALSALLGSLIVRGILYSLQKKA